MNAPAVTVVIPLYNKETTIARALASVTAQRLKDLEIIVVDDGSVDFSGAVVTGIGDPRVRLMRQTNQGPGQARNMGARAGSAPLIAFLDADDEWRPDFLSAGVAALTKHPDCGAYVCGYDSGKFARKRPNLVVQLGKTSGPEMLDAELDGDALKLHVDAMHSSCVIVRRTLYEHCGGFYGRRRCKYGEDSYFWLQVLFAAPVYWEPHALSVFHVEDSALGYATRRRRSVARPISTEPAALAAACPPAYRDALERVVEAFVEKDIRQLTASGAFAAAQALRRQHSLPEDGEFWRDRLAYVKALADGFRASF